jgi:RimJ/RimL family protein N-acetyltransferase
MLEAVLCDACDGGLNTVRVVTEAENAAALAVYQRVGFEIDRFISVFHLYRPK